MAQLAEPAQLGPEAAFVNHRPQQQQAGADWSAELREDNAQAVAELLLAAFGQLGGPASQSFCTHCWRYPDCVANDIGSS